MKDGLSSKEPDKKLAAVCGLYCEACSLYIATTEDPARLTALAKLFQLPEEEMRCYGCRSEKRGPYCRTCEMAPCAAERGIEFCGECAEYPCDTLKAFQAERPHRAELWEDLERIREVGYREWMVEKREHYSCPRCGTLNSAYDLKCRKCGEEPGCAFTAMHREKVEEALRIPPGGRKGGSGNSGKAEENQELP